MSEIPRRGSQGEAPRDQLAALTTLRFVAAAMIVVYHTYLPFGVGRWLAESVMLQQGVSFFFVLSGFILTHVYPSLGEGQTRRFLLARFARLWPLHAATFLAVVVLFSAGERTRPGADPWLVALANLTLVQAWSARPEVNFSYNGPSWSISTEVTFYLLFPLLVRDWVRTWPWKLALALAGAVGVVAYTNHRDVHDVYIMVYIHPVARLFEFVLGMTLVLAWRRLRSRAGLGIAGGTAVEIAALVLTAWAMANSITWAQAARGWPLVGVGGGLWLVNAGIPCVFFGMLIVVMALQRGLVSRVLATPMLVLLGEVSYGVYLIHHILVRIYTQHRFPVGGAAYVVFWAVLLGLAWLSWAWLEGPCRRVLLAGARLRGASAADHEATTRPGPG